MSANLQETAKPTAAPRVNWARDQELFYWALKWRVRSEDIMEAAQEVGPTVKNIEDCLRRKGWIR
jgi:Protein of unknown function (DUF3606)